MQYDEIMAYLKTLKPELEKEGIILLGLFGSFVKKSADEKSDIDILIETTDRFVQKYRGWSAFAYIDEHLRNRIEEKFHRKVDIFDKNSDSPLKKRILEEVCYV